MPSKIMIIRHGEKETPPQEELSLQGWKRAGAIAYAAPSWLNIDFLFAAGKSSESIRCIETVTPLHKLQGLHIHDKYVDDQHKELAEKLLNDETYAGKSILICWHHGKIPDLAHDLGAADAPNEWDGSVFDRIWSLDYSSNPTTPVFVDLPQALMFGDSST